MLVRLEAAAKILAVKAGTSTEPESLPDMTFLPWWSSALFVPATSAHVEEDVFANQYALSLKT